MADIHGSPGSAPQMPSAPNTGPAPVPYAGPGLAAEPPAYSAGAAEMRAPGAEVMGSVSGNAVQESGYAHDVNAGLITPYYPGSPAAIYVGGDADPGGRDVVESTIAGAVAAAEARYLEYQSDTFTQGSAIGDLMTLPPVPANALPAGDQPGLYPYQGDEPPAVS